MCSRIPWIVSYTPFNPKNKGTFVCGLKNKFTIESIILHYRHRGIFLDSSYRNKNENNAAMTNVIVLDEDLHLTPGTLFDLSSKSTYTARLTRLCVFY